MSKLERLNCRGIVLTASRLGVQIRTDKYTRFVWTYTVSVQLCVVESFELTTQSECADYYAALLRVFTESLGGLH